VADFAARQRIACDGKIAIGRAAARLVRPGQIVFLDGGTTCVQLARHLALDLRATVVTHSPSVAVELIDHAGIEVELIGGRLFKHSVVAVGATAIEAITRVRADSYFMGVTGVHAEIGLTTGDPEEAAVKRSLCRHAAEIIVLASHEKLGTVSPFVIVPLSDVDTLVVEADCSDAQTEPYREAGVNVVAADSP
jgi:DeoR/GlpR family transcriptional regulator of sugar metabolism